MATLTGKERLRRAYLGKDVDRVPWVPMVYQWFHVRRYDGTLPPELIGCRTALDALRAMKADVYGRHEAFVVHAQYSKCSFEYRYDGPELRLPEMPTCLMDVFGDKGNLNFVGRAHRHDRLITPKGILTASWRYEEATGAPFEVKNLWTDFDAEYDRIHSLLKDIEFVPDVDRWDRVRADLGEEGIAHVRIPPTPLKILHWLAGPERSYYFMMDHPNEIAELVRIYETKRVELVKKVCALPESLVYMSGDNMDSTTYSPPIFEQFCGHSFRQVADYLHENRKLLFTHACGQLRNVIALCLNSGVDGVEGMAPPPVGNLDFAEARQMLGPGFVLQGGMTHREEELEGDMAVRRDKIFARVEQLFRQLPDKRAFLFGSGCCPGPKTKYENLLALRDACWKYGQIGSWEAP